MSTLSRIDQLYFHVKGNRWHWYFSIFCRLSLAFGFIMAGMVKILDERFASGLSAIHPMGAYLEALYHTGYYYTFIGIAQVIAGVLLVFPKTVTLGALIYFPIILNICILSFAVRFEGSLLTAPLMVLANLYLLAWNYDKVRFILPIKHDSTWGMFAKPAKNSNRFPWRFFAGVVATMVLVVLFFRYGYEVMPRNSLKDCKSQFVGGPNETAGFEFCECVHTKGGDLDDCLEILESGL